MSVNVITEGRQINNIAERTDMKTVEYTVMYKVASVSVLGEDRINC